MRRFLVFALLLPACAAVGQDVVSQGGGPRVLKFSPDSVLLIKEIGALVGHQEGVLKVLLAPPRKGNLTGVQPVDLAEGDEIGMAEGKRLRAISELKPLYDAAPVGSEFTLGVRRDGRPIVVKFRRQSPGEMGSGGLIMIRPGDEEGTRLFPALGFRLKDEPYGLTVEEVLPGGPFPVQPGDGIRSLNGKKTGTVEEFETVLATIEVGQETALLISRGGTERTFRAPRPEAHGTVVKVR